MSLSIPLFVRPQFSGDTMRMERLERGAWVTFEKPFRPYIYSKFPIRNLDGEKVVRKLLSTHREAELHRYEFDTTLPVAELNRDEMLYSLIESHVRYTDRVAIDLPDYYASLPYPTPLRPLVVDIEGLTKHGRPKGKWWVGCRDAEGGTHQWALDGAQAFTEFAELVRRHDIIVGYNIVRYDWPILQRLAAEVRVPLPTAFLMYDVAHSVFADQTLHGIKSRGLKSVSRWFGFSATEIDTRNTANYSEADLLSYNASDLGATRGLYDIYFPRLIALAELMKFPLELVVEGEQYVSTLASVVAGRGLFRKGYVSDGTNAERHPGIGKAQGAYVSFYRKGHYVSLIKPDFKQLYPSIVLELNLGPDTTILERVEPMEKLEPYSCRKEGDVIRYRVPDANIGGMVNITVRTDEVSILREVLIELGRLRDDYKNRLAGLSEGERVHSPLHAMENAVKVLRNAIYGYTLSNEARFMDKSVGILVTATGREMIRSVEAHLNDVFGEGTVVESDTDGIYVTLHDGMTQEQVERQTQRALDEWVGGHLLVDAHFVLAYDSFPAGWFAAAKNYILLDSKGNIIRHGSGLKGTHRPNLEDKVIEDVAKKLLSGDSVNPRPYYDWNRYTLEDFLMRRALGMDLADYQYETVEKKVATQLLYRDETVETGQILEYYQATTGARAYLAEDHESLPPGQKLKDLDLSYYTKKLDKIFTALGIVGTRVTLDGFGGTTEATRRSLARTFDAVARGQFVTCQRCRGLGWFLPKGRIVPEDCNCDHGKVLVMT